MISADFSCCVAGFGREMGAAVTALGGVFSLRWLGWGYGGFETGFQVERLLQLVCLLLGGSGSFRDHGTLKVLGEWSQMCSDEICCSLILSAELSE